jgi:hypothetical protein
MVVDERAWNFFQMLSSLPFFSTIKYGPLDFRAHRIHRLKNNVRSPAYVQNVANQESCAARKQARHRTACGDGRHRLSMPLVQLPSQPPSRALRQSRVHRVWPLTAFQIPQPNKKNGYKDAAIGAA